MRDGNRRVQLEHVRLWPRWDCPYEGWKLLLIALEGELDPRWDCPYEGWKPPLSGYGSDYLNRWDCPYEGWKPKFHSCNAMTYKLGLSL